MKPITTCLAATTLTSLLAAQAQTKFLANDAVAGDFLGSSISVGAQYTLLGATGVDYIGNNGGAAYAISTTTGEEVVRLVPSSSAPKFGTSVGVDGGLAVVGAPSASHDALLFGGAAYLYVLPSGQERFRFQRSDPAAFDAFGSAVDISGMNAIVGASRDDDTGGESGSAYIFNTTTGQQVQKLTPNNGSAGSQFGAAVAIHGDYAVVGSPYKAPAGGAHLFDVTTGQELAFLDANSTVGGRYGWSVAIDGNRAIVGAPFESSEGAAYVFTVPGGQLLGRIPNPSPSIYESFGMSVTLDGDLAVIGAPLSDNVAGNESGAAFVFDIPTLSLLTTLATGDLSAADWFGHAVGLHGETLVTSSPRDSDKGLESGSATIFELSGSINYGNGLCHAIDSVCPCAGGFGPGQGCGNSTGVTGAALNGSGEASIANDTFRLQVTGLPGAKPGLMLRAAQSLNGAAGNPAGDGLLCAAGQVARSQVQMSASGINTFVDFKGQPFGTWSYGAGIPVHYQYWYRDPQNSCSGLGFNLSNAWVVTWAP